MRDSIAKKISATLEKGIKSETEVVYLLCEIRKLLDREAPDPSLFALRLYCHWALHVDLTHQNTTLLFLERVNKFAESVLAGSTNVVEEHRMRREFVFLDTFREQLSKFLEKHDLSKALCDESERWHEFLKNYAGVIEDGSLSCRTEVPNLTIVKEVVFTKGRKAHANSYVPFQLSWAIHLVDGRVMTLEVEASEAEGGQMISHSVSLK